MAPLIPVYGRMYQLEPFRKDISMAQMGVRRRSGGVQMGSPHGYTPARTTHTPWDVTGLGSG